MATQQPKPNTNMNTRKVTETQTQKKQNHDKSTTLEWSVMITGNNILFEILTFFILDIDDCIGVTCQHGGHCLDGLASYTCSCPSGYTGRHCEQGKYYSNRRNFLIQLRGKQRRVRIYNNYCCHRLIISYANTAVKERK